MRPWFFCLLLLNLAWPVAAAERIIALAPHIVENLFAIGAGDSVVGVVEHSDYPAKAQQITVVGNHLQINIEAVLALKPDLIVAWRSGNPETDIQRLAGFGIPVIYSDAHTLEDVAAELRQLGQAAGQVAAAEQLAANFEQRLTALKQHYATRQPLSVFYELWPSPLTTVAKGAWPQQFLDICHLQNPFIDHLQPYPNVAIEQVILAAPEVIIRPFDNTRTSVEQTHWEKWSTIPAVQHKQFIWVNGDRLHRMTVRALDELQQLCEASDQLRNAPD